MQIQLQPGTVQAIEIHQEEIHLKVGMGELWVTCAGQDFILRSGEQMRLQSGKVIWEAMSGPATFCLSSQSSRYPIFERKRQRSAQPCA